MYIGTQYYSQASPYSMLDKHQIEQIHYASMRILAEKGLVLQHPEAVKMLKKAGATVDGERVFLPRGLVEWALQQVPSGFALYDRNGDLAVRAEDKNVYYGSGSDTMVLFDYETRAAKPWSKKNVQDAVRLLDALENFDFTMSMGLISDVPDEVNTQEQYAAMIRNTIKPHVVVCNNKEDLEDIFNMYIAVRGGKEELRRKPYAAVYNEPTSPLLCTYTAIDKLLLCADYGMPSNFATGGLAGATTPITAAGTILLSNAECLFGLTIQQVYRPGAPFLYGYCNSPIEMRTVQSVYAAPLALQVQVGMCDMAHYYQLPSWGEAGDSVSKVCDEQSAMEAMQLMQVSAMSGCSLIHDGGYMNFGLGFSLEHLMVCNEIIGRIKEFMKGVVVNEETLAMDDILKVKVGGDFLRDKLTRSHMRKGWTGDLSDMNAYSTWFEAGATTMGERAHEKVKKILAEYQPAPLDPQADAAIEAILQAAWAKLK